MGRIAKDRSNKEVINPEGRRLAEELRILRSIPKKERTEEQNNRVTEIINTLYTPTLYGYSDFLIHKYYPAFWASPEHEAYLNYFHLVIIENLDKYDGTTAMTTFINMYVYCINKAVAEEDGITQGSNTTLSAIKKVKRYLMSKGIAEEDITPDIIRDYMRDTSAATIDGALVAGEIACPTKFNAELDCEFESHIDTPEVAYEKQERTKELNRLMTSIPDIYSVIIAAKTGYDYKSDKGRDLAAIGRDMNVINLVKSSGFNNLIRNDVDGEYIDKNDVSTLYNSGIALLRGITSPRKRIEYAIDSFNEGQDAQEFSLKREAEECLSVVMF